MRVGYISSSTAFQYHQQESTLFLSHLVNVLKFIKCPFPRDIKLHLILQDIFTLFPTRNFCKVAFLLGKIVCQPHLGQMSLNPGKKMC